MKLFKASLLLAAVVSVAACSTLKKSNTATAPVPPSNTAANTPAPPKPVRPRNGVYAPGEEELAAIRLKYKDVNMQTLADGHALYIGVCTNCHSAKNIYAQPEAEWPAIIDDMAQKARITDAQKDAVLKYVLAIKATQGS